MSLTIILSQSYYVIHAASTEQIDKAKEVIKKLTFKYQPDAFENPGEPYNLHLYLSSAQYTYCVLVYGVLHAVAITLKSITHEANSVLSCGC